MNDEKDKAKDIINKNDWSGTDSKFQLAHKVLLEKYDEAIEIMKIIGKNDKMRMAYAEWPLFNDFRKTSQFKDTYKEIYGLDYQYTESQSTKWEDTINEAMEMIKARKSKDKNI